MTKKTRLHARAAQKNTQHVSTHKHSTTPAKIGVAASVAIASTLAMAQVAQAKTAKSESQELVQAQAQTQTLPTPTGKANIKGEQPTAGSGSAAAAKTQTHKTNAVTSVKAAPADMAPVTPTAAGSTAAPATASTPAPASTQNQQNPQNQVIAPNTQNPSASDTESANNQVKREEDTKKTYTFTITYCVEGYNQKQLLQPSEYTFTKDTLDKLSEDNPDGESLFIPVKTTKGYYAPRGAYIKKDGKYVLDTTKDASVQSYIKIDKKLVTDNINQIASTDTHIVSNYVMEYRPKTVNYYVRHMIQDPANPNSFKEYSSVPYTITVPAAGGANTGASTGAGAGAASTGGTSTSSSPAQETIHVTKSTGLVGQNLYPQAINIPGYHAEENIISSPIPDDEDYSEDAGATSSSANNKSKKYLVLELRYLLNKHNVSYDTQGGTAIQSKVFSYSMTVDAVKDPTRKGYKFLGWTKELSTSTPAAVSGTPAPQTPDKSKDASKISSMPDADVRFVAHWKPASEHAQYQINIWVQKADLPKPDDPTNMDNYDFIGQVQKEGKSDGTIQDADLNLNNDQMTKLAWPDQNLRGAITNKEDFDKYFMEDNATSTLTKKMNSKEEPEYFGAKEKRPLTKIRPDGTTVVNKVFNRRVYELIFANPDIVKDGNTSKIFTKNGTEQYDVDHFTITKGGKEYNDTDKNKLYKVTYRFGQTIHYTSGFPTDAETKRYKTEDEDSRAFGLGWRVANDAEQVIYVDTPPYRFDVKHFIAPQPKGSGDFSQNNIRLFGEQLTPYQRVLVPDANTGGAGSIHVLVKLETEESARRNDDNNREYVASELSYTKDDTLNTDYNYGAPTIEGFESLQQTQKITTQDEDDYYDKLAEELTDVWTKDHPDEDDPSGGDEDFRDWVAQKFPHLVFTQEGSDGNGLEENGLLIFEYKRKHASVKFAVDQVTPIQNAGAQASTQEPFGTNLKKFALNYNDAVKKNDPDKGKQFASSYTFKLDGKTYTFKRPDNLPEDYEFAGWSLDPAGTQKLASLKSDGTPYTAQEIAELLKKSPEDIAKALSNAPLESAGITLYASWKRVDTTHTIDVDMDYDNLAHTTVRVVHGNKAKKATTTIHDEQNDTQKDYSDCFPAVAERPGYIFNGWLQKYTKPDGSEQWLPFSFKAPIVENLEVKAEWIEDKRVKGTIKHIFLRDGYTAEEYKQAVSTHDLARARAMIKYEKTNVYSNLRPRSSYAAEAAYRDGKYFTDHTYSTFIVSKNEQDNHAEFIYTPYATRRYTVHYKDAAGNELAAPETFESNKLNYDVAHAKVIPGYRLQSTEMLARQLTFKPKDDGSYEKNYDIDFIYDDVRILKRKDGDQVTPDNYSRLQFDTQTTELIMENGKVTSKISNVKGGDLSPFNGTNTGDTQHPTSVLTFDAVKGTKAYEVPLPVPHAKDGYTFTGWTSKVVYKRGEEAVEGAGRLPMFSEEFPYKVVYTAHFKKTQVTFVGANDNATPPDGYYKVTYSADQNGRLSREVSDGNGGKKTETLDTLTNVVVIDKYKDNVIEAPVAVPDKGFEEKGDFEFKGRDEKDRSYIKHFEMITPVAAEKRFVLPGHGLLKFGESARTLIQNRDKYASEEDLTTGTQPTGVQAATFEFCDEKGAHTTLDQTTPGEHKIFIKVTAGRKNSRVSKLVPYFYEVLPQMSFGEAFNAHKYSEDIKNQYKKITFTSNATEGELIGKDHTTDAGENKTLETYVYTGKGAATTYTLDLPSALGKDYESEGYHYVFRGWRKLAAHSTPAVDFKNFKPTIKPSERYSNIEKPTTDLTYEAVYEKIPYITQKTNDGNVPPDSVVVSFKPAAGRAWKDGSTGPKVLYIKKGMDISKLDEHGVPIKPGETKKSILQVLGEQLYGYTDDWTKSSMDGITLIENMSTGAGADGWKSNNAFQEFVAHQTAYTDPVGGVEKTIIQGTAAPEALDFVQNKDVFVPSETSTVESITAEYVKAPSTDAAANLTVPIKVTVKYKDSSDATHTRVYNITGALHVLGDVLEKKNAPAEQGLKDKYTTITFVSKKQKVVDAQGHETSQTEDPGQVSGASESVDKTQSELTYLAFKKDNASYTINIPQVTGLDYMANGYHYVFTGWKQVQTAAHAADVVLPADARSMTFDAQKDVVFEAQYKKVPYIVTKVTDGKIPEDSVVVSFKPAPGRKWADGSTGPKVLYIKKGMDISHLDEHGRPIPAGDTTTPSILDVLGSKLSAYDHDWSKSSMDGITLIKSMKEGAGENGWKSNNAFQEFVAHQKPHTKPETIAEYQAIIQNTTVPTPNDFIKNDQDLKDLLMKGGVAVPGQENIESYKVEFVGKAPESKIAGTYLVPLKVTIKYRDMDSEDVFMLNSQLKVIYGVLYGKNKPSKDKQPIDYKVFDGHYRKVTFITDDNEKNQHKGTIIGDEDKNSVDYYVAKDQELRVRVPKMLNQDYEKDGYHYKFVGWKLVPSADTSVKDDKNELGKDDIKFGTPDADSLKVTKTAGDLIYKAVYEKIKYVENKPVDGTVPADSVVVSFKPAPGRKWADGSIGPKVLYIKKDTDISKIDKDGKPTDDPKQSVLAWLGAQLHDYEGDWSKSDMEGITAESSMNKAHKADTKAWLSKDAFQEFVAHQKAVVDPTVKNEIVITQYGDVPVAKDFIENIKALEGDNIAKKKDGSLDIEVHYGKDDSKRPNSDAAGVYTVPIFITVKHADMAAPIVYKLTSVLRVMDKVLSSTTADKIVTSIENKQKQATPGTEPNLTPEEQQFKDNYAKVVFSSGTDGTFEGGKDKATHYVKKNTDITLDMPTVIAKEKQTDPRTGEKYRYIFTGWTLEITPNTPQGGASGQGTQGGEQAQPTRTPRHRRSLDAVSPFTTLVQTDTPGNTPGTPAEGSTPTTISVVVSAEDLKPENLPKTLRKLEAKYGKTFTQATYNFTAQYTKQPYVVDASTQNTMHEGDVPVMFLPAPKHTWQDGSSRPYVYYVNAGNGSIIKNANDLKAQLGSFVDWDVYDNKRQLVTDPAEIAKAFKNPEHAYTFIAKQSELPDITPKDDIVMGVYDEVPNYDKLIHDIKQGDTTIPGLEAFMKSDRFAGFAAPSTELQLNPNASRPGMYVVHFGLNYKDDTGKIQTKDIAVNVRVLPRVIAAQNAPADGTPEDAFIKKNYTKVMYRVAMNDKGGRITSPYTTFYVRRGYTIDPNALLYFDEGTRADHTKGNEEIGVPGTEANAGYTFYDWQKVDANDKGDVVYLAHFHKLPITHFTLKTATEAEQPFSTRLIGDAQNHPIYKPKPGTKLPDGVTVTCDGATCTISGTPHITDWKSGETERDIELHFEAVDKRSADKYGRSSFGLQKEITVHIVVQRPHATSGGAGGGMYIGTGESIPWTELTPATKVPAEPEPAQPEATAAPQARKHAHAHLPQTSDATFAAGAAELLGMGLGMISAVALARKKRREDDDAPDDGDAKGGASGRA